MLPSDIILKCKQRDRQAFKALYEHCLPYVFTVVKGYTDNPEFRKDLVQEVFAKIFLHIDSFDLQKGEFKGWLRKIAVNQCLMFLRDQKKRFEFEDLEHAPPDMEPSQEADLGKLSPGISERILSQMPLGYRQVFSLIVFDGYSHDEAGKILGISAETSRSQFSRSKQWLRQYFTNNKTLIENEL